MTGTERLTGKIISDARQAAEANVAKARHDADEIIGTALAEAKAIGAASGREAARNAEEHERRLISAAELEGKKAILSLKQRLIDDLFAQAKKLLNEKSRPEYEALLLDMISASAFGEAEIIISQRDRERLSEGFINSVNTVLSAAGKPYKLTLSNEAKLADGGFILRSKDIEIDCSFDSILRIKRDSLEALGAKMLFG